MTIRTLSTLSLGLVTAAITWASTGPTASATPPGLQDRINAATADAATRGATVQIAYLDRLTGHYATNNGGRASKQTASVAKVFIADDLLLRASHGQLALSPGDRGAMVAMLRSSDDGAAQSFWNRFGGASIVAHVIDRYHMGDAHVAGQWFLTTVSPADMVSYYNQMISGTGGLNPADRDFILDQLRASTPTGSDGFDQRFGLPSGLRNEPTQAIKQGWMVGEGGKWVHNSTDIVGPNERYIVVVFAQEPVNLGEAHARDTINRVSAILFPTGTARETPVDPVMEQVQQWWKSVTHAP